MSKPSACLPAQVGSGFVVGVRCVQDPRFGHTRSVSGDEPILDLEDLLNPEEQQQFRRLCLPTTVDELIELRTVVELHLQQIRDHAGPAADVETAERIATALSQLLSTEDAYKPDERALIRGAVEYFLLADDASGDLEDALGFDDDARVLNSVLDRVGRSDLRVELG